MILSRYHFWLMLPIVHHRNTTSVVSTLLNRPHRLLLFITVCYRLKKTFLKFNAFFQKNTLDFNHKNFLPLFKSLDQANCRNFKNSIIIMILNLTI
jgi:hypothetical protein